MGRFTRLGVALIAAAALAVLAAILVPFAIADRVWAAAARETAAATGTRIGADGPVRLKLFPAPRLLASNVEIGNANGASLVHVDRARLELSWGDLLAGRVEAKHIHLRYARILPLPPHPPIDIDIRRNGRSATVAASFEDGAVRAEVEAAPGVLEIRALTIRAEGYSASGSGRLTGGDDPRLDLAFDRIEGGILPVGKGGFAAVLASDGMVIERLSFQGANGFEASFFGLALADHGAIRVEGGLEGRAPAQAGTAEATARLAAILGGENGRVDITEIDLRSPETRLSGTLRGSLAATPSVAADLRLEALRLDGAAAPPPGWLAALGAVPTAELRLRIGRLSWPGSVAEGVILDLTRAGDQVTVRELAARNLNGAPFHAQGRLALAPLDPRAVFDSLVFRYATLVGSGRGSVDLSGAVPRISLEAALDGPLALDAIVPPLPPLPPEPMTRRAAAAAAAAPRPAPPPAAGWSRERFSFPPIPAVEADIRVTAPRLLWRGLRLDEARLDARIGDEALIVDRLSGRLYGGRFELNGRAALAGGAPSFSGGVSMSDGDLKTALRDYAGINEIAGHLDGYAQFSASGSSAAELMAGLKGVAQVHCRDGTIEGFNLAAMSDGLKRLQRPTDLAEVFRLGLGGGRTPFSALGGTLRIEQGVARLENVRLAARSGEMRTTGNINLAAWTVDIGNQFKLTEHPDLPPFALKLNGRMDAPRRVFDIQDLQAQLVRRGRAPAR